MAYKEACEVTWLLESLSSATWISDLTWRQHAAVRYTAAEAVYHLVPVMMQRQLG